MSKHTEGKLTLDAGYIRDKDGDLLISLPFMLGDEQDKANAEHIVKCWNNHEAMYEALVKFVDSYKSLQREKCDVALRMTKEVLAKIEEE